MSRMRMQCPTCSALLQLFIQPGVEVVRCPKCSKPMRVPVQAPPPKQMPTASLVEDEDEPEDEEDLEERPVRREQPRRPKRKKRRQSMFVKAPFVIAGVFLVALTVVLVFFASGGGGALSRALANLGIAGSDLKPITEGPFKGCRPEDFLPPDEECAMRFDARPRRLYQSAFFKALSPAIQEKLRQPMMADGKTRRSPEDCEATVGVAPLAGSNDSGIAVNRFIDEFDFKLADRQELVSAGSEAGVVVYKPRGSRIAFNLAQPGPGVLMTGSDADFLAKRLKAAKPGAGTPSPRTLLRVKILGFRKALELSKREIPAPALAFLSAVGDDATGELTVDVGSTLTARMDINTSSSTAAAELGKKINEGLQGLSGLLAIMPPDKRDKIQKSLKPILDRKASVSGRRVSFDVEIDAETVNSLSDVSPPMGPRF